MNGSAHRFYGINLNQSVVLSQIGFDGKTGTAWNRLFRIATGNVIITVLGFVPGALSAVFLSLRSRDIADNFRLLRHRVDHREAWS
jgi:hypothetical protein